MNHPNFRHYEMPKTGPAPAYYKAWQDWYGVTKEEAFSQLRLEGVLEASTDEGRERVWRAACRRAMRKKKKEAVNGQ